VVVLLELQDLSRRVVAATLPLLATSLVLTASRTALVGVLLMGVWGLVDRRLGRACRTALLAMPLLYAVAWLALDAWSRLSHHVFGAAQRLAEADLSASRFRIWADTVELIRMHPLGGVGVGEFNFAWSLSAMPARPVAFFDHTHNLLLQWAVEMGVPLALLLTALLAWGLWRIAAAAATGDPRRALMLRAALALLLLMAVHSQLEYPLWYAYFLLPTAWVLGFGLSLAAAPQRSGVAAGGAPPSPAAGSRRPGSTGARLVLAGLALCAAALAATADYLRVAAIFDDRNPQPLAQRIAAGQRSVLFGHHADYAAATTSPHPELEMDAFRRAAHYLLDTRLMTAWAQAWAASGDLARARYLAERLREFRNPNSQSYFAVCAAEPPALPAAAATPASGAGPAVAPPAARPYQCLGPDPQVILRWSDFR
jgi:hypothetical protein